MISLLASAPKMDGSVFDETSVGISVGIAVGISVGGPVGVSMGTVVGVSVGAPLLSRVGTSVAVGGADGVPLAQADKRRTNTNRKSFVRRKFIWKDVP